MKRNALTIAAMVAGVSVLAMAVAWGQADSADQTAGGASGDSAGQTAPDKPDRPAKVSKYRRLLPDYSEGLTGVLGPFQWGRAIDMGGDARFADKFGQPQADGEYLYLYQFMRHRRAKVATPLLHERNNFKSIETDLAFRVQPWRIILNSRRPHNFKLIQGYIQNRSDWQHGDNTDLAHLAEGDRVCVFLPIRHERHDTPTPEQVYDQKGYFVSPIYQAQSACIIEWKAGEMIHYAWFTGGKDKLHPRILYDLAPHFDGDKTVRPGETKPIFEFTIDGKGGWTFKMERDGRDGLSGGEDKDGWDLVVTHQSPGAKPYTVDVTRANSAWAMSVFSPGGSPEDSSEALVKLHPIDRDTGKDVPWPKRNRRVRSMELDKYRKLIRSDTYVPAERDVK